LDTRQTLRFEDFHSPLTGAYLKTLQIFHFAMALGVLVFLFAVLFYFVFEGGGTPRAGNDDLVLLLTIAHVVYGFLAYPVAWFLHARLLRRAFTEGRSGGSAMAVLGGLRTASIIRLAFLEGIAFFGLVVLFIAIQGGVLQTTPIYWLNLYSTLIMLAYVLLFFPTRERVQVLIRSMIAG
jgi:hypothetical protein